MSGAGENAVVGTTISGSGRDGVRLESGANGNSVTGNSATGNTT